MLCPEKTGKISTLVWTISFPDKGAKGRAPIDVIRVRNAPHLDELSFMLQRLKMVNLQLGSRKIDLS